jgi:MscS family membrane protein
MNKLGFLRLILLLIPVLFWGGNLNAQTTMLKAVTQELSKETAEKFENQEKAAAPKGPYDEFGRGVPRTSVKGFMDATDEGDYELAANFLDLRYLP